MRKIFAMTGIRRRKLNLASMHWGVCSKMLIKSQFVRNIELDVELL